MNVLVISSHSLYKNPERSYVHNQVKNLVIDNNVTVLVPIPFGKKNLKNRFFPFLTRLVIDDVNVIYYRYFSFSRFGKKVINHISMKLSYFFFVKRKMKKNKFDIIHSHAFSDVRKLSVYLKKKMNIPLVVTAHGSDISKVYNKQKVNTIKKYCDSVDAVISVSSKLENMIKEAQTNTPVHTILDGFDSSNIVSNVKKEFVILQVCNLIKQKKVDITILALSEIIKEYPNVKMIVIGDGKEKDALKDLCAKEGLLSNVSFLGSQTNKQVLSYMAKSQFFVMPSVNEGFGIVYLEAMASRCITIGTENEGISDVISSNVNGFLVKKDDYKKIAEIIIGIANDEKRIKDISQKGYEDAILLSWNENARKTNLLYKQILNKEWNE